MVVTSLAMPYAATWHRLHGRARARSLAQAPRTTAAPVARAVLLDRDDTLIADVPYNGDPGRVQPVDGAREALDRLRSHGVRLAVVSNQSGVARGLITAEDVEAVNARADELLGPIGTWLWCPHGPADGCDCRKPRPGLIRRAAAALGVAPADCVVIGDIGADVEAASAAGAQAILVPTARTREEEIAAAPQVAPDLRAAVDALLGASGAAVERREPVAA